MMENENMELLCLQIITNAGEARSECMAALAAAAEGKFDEADAMIKQGEEAFAQGHHGHADLLTKEASGELGGAGLLLIHAEDQLMSAEGFRTIAEEFIALYKKLA